MSEVVLFTQRRHPDGRGTRDGRADRAGPVRVPAAATRRGDAAVPSPDREGCVLSRQIASAVLAIPLEEIARANRGEAEICTARHVAMYLAHVIFQVPLTAIGADFGRDRTSVAHAIRRVEDQRDRPEFDAQLTRLEVLAGECRALLDRQRSGQ